MKIEMMIKLCILLVLTGSSLSCLDKHTARQVTEPEKREPIEITSAIQSSSDSGIFEKIGSEQMQVKLGQYTFTLPHDWRDTSSYIYKAKDQKRALTVSFGKTREPLSLDDLISQRRQQLVDTMGDEVEFMSRGKGKISMLPAIYLSFRFGDQDKQYLEYWATAYYKENKYVAISYVGPREDELLGATFKHIMETSWPASQSVPEPVEPDYVWRQGHNLLLQVPMALSPPRHYTYESPSGIKLKASLYSPGDDWPKRSVQDDAAKDLRFGGTQGETHNGTFDGFAIGQLDYIFQGGDPLEPTLYRAHRAHVAGSGSRLFLFVKGNESQAKQIDEFWQQLLTSLRVDSESM
ncbi:MAG: hypothetical protein ACJA13_002992 [Paraglaciecola sp.]